MDKFKFIESTLQEAANLLLTEKEKGFSQTNKNNDVRDVLTTVDVLIGNFIHKKIAKNFPGDIIYSEEENSENLILNKNLWTIDPIDGTSNFARDIPHFGICITYLEQGQPLVGGIINPITKELFMAEYGRGAFLNGKTVSVSKIDEMKKTSVISSIGRDPTVRAWMQESLLKLSPLIKSQKQFGSSGLDMCFLGTGRVDAFLYGQLSTYDIACAILFVKEAGGLVVGEDFLPIKFQLKFQKIFAFNNQKILEEFKKLIK